MSSGTVNPFVDFGSNANDTNENNSTSIQPVADGEGVNQTVLTRPTENMRKRSEVIRGRQVDSLFLENADRVLVISGPGKITWPGSTTAGANGIPVLSDVLWILPMLTPGFAQAAPVPPVASAFGVLHLQRATGPSNAILVTSQRRSYAAGDQINITVTPGSVYSCTLDVEDTGALRRTIKIVATGSTTLGTVIASLNALTPPAPDNASALVTAALEGGAVNGDLILTSQARQFVVGNYDGEGHAVTPANLASFFSGSPGQALAEGDTLCVSYAMLYDTASNGGRRQSIPENSNTAVPTGSFFNSRVHPENLFNALPICKVINGSLVFATGVEIAAGEIDASLSGTIEPSPIIRNGGFEHGVTGDNTWYAVTDWENRTDVAVNGSWRLGIATVDTGAKALEFNRTSTGAATARIEQIQEIPVTPGNNITVSIRCKQLIAPTAGSYVIGLYWGDADSAASSSSTVSFIVLSSTDGAFRTVTGTVAVPAGKRFLKYVTVEVSAVTAASTGVALVVDNLQVVLEGIAPTTTKPINQARLKPASVDAVLLEDPNAFQLGDLAALLRFIRGVPTTPVTHGKVVLERKDQTYSASSLPPAFAIWGHVMELGLKLLADAASNAVARISVPRSNTLEFTLLFESIPTATDATGFRIYGTVDNGNASPAGSALSITTNMAYDGTQWIPDRSDRASFMMQLRPEGLRMYHSPAGAGLIPTSSLIPISLWSGPRATTSTNNAFRPLLQVFDPAGNARSAIDHLGFRGGQVLEYQPIWPFGANAPSGWARSATANAHSTAGVFNASVLTNIVAWNLGVTSTSGTDSATLATTANLIQMGDPNNLVAFMEWDAIHSGLNVSSLLAEVDMGLASDAGFVAGKALFQKVDGSTNWWFLTTDVNNISSTLVDTGVPVGANFTKKRFRIELYGTNIAGGLRALAYINGAIVAQVTTNLPQNATTYAALGEIFSISRSSGGAVIDLWITPPKIGVRGALSDFDL